jgi:hypothetical protein
MIRLEANDCKDRYVAFLDVLGFGALILRDYSAALKHYVEFSKVAGPGTEIGAASVRIISDSIIVVGAELRDVVHAANQLCQAALYADFLIRGGIAFGHHAEWQEDNNLFVVSEPLVHAVEVEKTVGHPCIALHSSVTVPPEAWRFKASSFERPLLFFEGRWIVNPFSLIWGTSAAHRVEMMKGSIQSTPRNTSGFSACMRQFEQGRLHGQRVTRTRPLIAK